MGLGRGVRSGSLPRDDAVVAANGLHCRSDGTSVVEVHSARVVGNLGVVKVCKSRRCNSVDS